MTSPTATLLDCEPWSASEEAAVADAVATERQFLERLL